MNDNVCSDLRQALQVFLLDGVNVYRGKHGDCVLQLPIRDRSGDPIEVMVRHGDGKIVLDDGGIIAGHLFSLGQQSIHSPAFKLLKRLSTAYDFQIDFDRGVVSFGVSDDGITERIMDLLKIIITLTTATPFIRVRENLPAIGGQRLRTRIKKAYIEKNILDVVEPNFYLRGAAVESWLVDFHWQIQNSGEQKDVFVVALDLDVAEPLQKAERIASLALDTRSAISENFLRIVIDQPDILNQAADTATAEAARFLREHKRTLKYALYDFSEELQRQEFINQSVDELLGDMGKDWRTMWQEKNPKTARMQ